MFSGTQTNEIRQPRSSSHQQAQAGEQGDERLARAEAQAHQGGRRVRRRPPVPAGPRRHQPSVTGGCAVAAQQVTGGGAPYQAMDHQVSVSPQAAVKGEHIAQARAHPSSGTIETMSPSRMKGNMLPPPARKRQVCPRCHHAVQQ
jgi:hypothetical protein